MRTFFKCIALLVSPVVVFFGCWILAIGCSRVHVMVRNQSGATVSNLVISGSCKERRAEVLLAQSEWHTSTPYHKGEISFSFDSAGVSHHTNIGVKSEFLAVTYTIDTNTIIGVDTRR